MLLWLLQPTVMPTVRRKAVIAAIRAAGKILKKQVLKARYSHGIGFKTLHLWTPKVLLPLASVREVLDNLRPTLRSPYYGLA
jgi:hypothetical protein